MTVDLKDRRTKSPVSSDYQGLAVEWICDVVHEIFEG
jgi:hypothetical protein